MAMSLRNQMWQKIKILICKVEASRLLDQYKLQLTKHLPGLGCFTSYSVTLKRMDQNVGVKMKSFFVLWILILLHDWVTTDGFWIEGRIYWTLSYSAWLPPYRSLYYTHTHTHTLVSTVTSSLLLLGSSFQWPPTSATNISQHSAWAAQKTPLPIIAVFSCYHENILLYGAIT
jgi:hypothetical protein